MQSNNKTTITIKAHGKKVRITISTNEPTIEQLADQIRNAVIALGYTQKAVTEHLGDFS